MELYTMETIRKCPYTSHILIPPSAPHQSTFFVLTIVEKGEACIEFYSKNGNATKTINVTSNYCFIIYPYSPIIYKSFSKNFACRDLYLNEKSMKECCDFLEKGLYDKLLDLPYAPVFKLSSSSLIFVAECASILTGVKTSERKNYLHKSLVSLLISQYILSKSSNNVFPVWISGFLRRLDDDKFVSMSVEEMVKTTNYSHGYVNREFKKYLGCSIIQFIIRKKLDKATLLLATTDYSVESISDLLNFSNVSNFINVFKKRYGITPAKYRKLHGSSIQMDTYQEWGDTTYFDK